jgi:hypothetical protein
MPQTSCGLAVVGKGPPTTPASSSSASAATAVWPKLAAQGSIRPRAGA